MTSAVSFGFRTELFLLVSSAAIFLWAHHGNADDVLGYDDTPRLPGSEWRVHDRQRPQPAIVAPGKEAGDPPADAIVLFDGKNLSEWEGGDPKGVEGNCINILMTGGIATKRKFGDCQLHIEWATSAKPDGIATNWGNSGILFLGGKNK